MAWSFDMLCVLARAFLQRLGFQLAERIFPERSLEREVKNRGKNSKDDLHEENIRARDRICALELRLAQQELVIRQYHDLVAIYVSMPNAMLPVSQDVRAKAVERSNHHEA